MMWDMVKAAMLGAYAGALAARLLYGWWKTGKH
jgi:isopentenyl diphosphate isomerase/L-lactate dehydrogenase-like FMN-dependent dehydrogenase